MREHGRPGGLKARFSRPGGAESKYFTNNPGPERDAAKLSTVVPGRAEREAGTHNPREQF
ncbi:hypothetical protein BRDID11002_40650 [Bradyrhizobium diazoefficiens]